MSTFATWGHLARGHTLKILDQIVSVIDHSHEVNPKCTAFKPNLYPELKDVNKEAASKSIVCARFF